MKKFANLLETVEQTNQTESLDQSTPSRIQHQMQIDKLGQTLEQFILYSERSATQYADKLSRLEGVTKRLQELMQRLSRDSEA